MFKHVEHMRKYALYIMSRAYGGKGKDNESMFDSYPLQKLTEVLCYEDDEEARAACQHYGVTVGVLDDIEGGEPTIYWKRGKFREPKDPEKGSVIPLRPSKMMKTIESKLKGATRLAVCRGEVSSEESFLSSAQVQLRRGSVRGSASTGSSAPQVEAREAVLREWKEKEEERKIKQRNEEEARQRLEEAKRQEIEKLRLAELERKQKLEERMRQIQFQEERERKRLAELEQKRLEQEQREFQAAQEKERARQKAQSEERQRQLELERQIALRRQEEERQHAEEERKRREEEERIQQDLQRQEEERNQLELLRKQDEARKRLEEERIRRQVESHRLQQELKQRVNHAQKALLWRLLVEKTKHHIAAARTKESLLRLNPITHSSAMTSDRININSCTATMRSNPNPTDTAKYDLRRVLEGALLSNDDTSNLGSSFAEKTKDALARSDFPSMSHPSSTSTYLYKVAVFLPSPHSPLNEGMCGLVRSWIKSRLAYDTVHSSQSAEVNVKVVVVDMWTHSNTSNCDAALLVIPPPWSNYQSDGHLEDLKVLASEVDETIPRAVLALTEDFEPSTTHDKRELQILGSNAADSPIARNTELNLAALDRSLSTCMNSMAEIFAKSTPRLIERFTLDYVLNKCMNEVIWSIDSVDNWDDLASSARAVMLSFVNEVDAACSPWRDEGSSWPSSEFVVEGTVPDYFRAGADLPANWASTTSRVFLSENLGSVADLLSGPMAKVMRTLIDGAPSEVFDDCEYLYERRFYKRCLQRALHWRVRARTDDNSGPYLYLPSGLIDEVVRLAVASQSYSTVRQIQQFTFFSDNDNEFVAGGIDNKLASDPRSPFSGGDSFGEDIDPPPHETPRDMPSPSVKRPWTDPSPKYASRALLEDTLASPKTANKRQRRNKSKPTKELSASISYTKRLQKLLNGDETQDMIIPSLDQRSLLLSAALQGAPALRPLD